MESARSLALGGQVIQASEMSDKGWLDADHLMLRCPFCGEPVFFRKGLQRQQHFAHFSDLPTRQQDECELRQQSVGGSGYGESGQKRGQSLERFKQKIKGIFAGEYRDFEEKVLVARQNSGKEIENYSQIYLGSFSLVFDTSRKLCNDRYSGDTLPVLMEREKILIEVISYLNNKSAREILESFIAFSLYYPKPVLLETEPCLKNEFLHAICSNLVDVKWLEAFREVCLDLEKDQSLGMNYLERKNEGIEEINKSDKQNKKNPQRAISGRDIRISITLTVEEITNGCSKHVEVERKVECSTCNGFTTVMRKHRGMFSTKCRECNGELRILSRQIHEIHFPSAKSRGWFHRAEVSRLFGHSYTRNYTHVVKGLGHDGFNGGEPGNLNISVAADSIEDLDEFQHPFSWWF
ncbi:MAG: hypothetical protein ACFB0G_03565 [Leptolyngbyaceae cyanobacterium]